MSSTAMCLKVLASVNALDRPKGASPLQCFVSGPGSCRVSASHDAMSGAAEGYGVITVVAGATALVAALFIARFPLQLLSVG